MKIKYEEVFKILDGDTRRYMREDFLEENKDKHVVSIKEENKKYYYAFNKVFSQKECCEHVVEIFNSVRVENDKDGLFELAEHKGFYHIEFNEDA